MRNWYKFFLFDNSKININLDRDQSFSDHERSMGGYETNEYYTSKKSFLEKYFNNRHQVYNIFLQQNLLKEDKVLSLGSGRCISELFLLDHGYNIICSDIEVPNCYKKSKEIFKDFKYEKLNILNHVYHKKFNSIICFSMLYLFEKKELDIFFKNTWNTLEHEGSLILDPGGAENNLFTLFYDTIYLPLETLLVFLISKFFSKKYFLFKKHQGYRFSNKELIKIAIKNGFKFLKIENKDFYQELKRSKVINFLINKFPKTKNIFWLFGRFVPYIRIFKFVKINERNT